MRIRRGLFAFCLACLVVSCASPALAPIGIRTLQKGGSTPPATPASPNPAPTPQPVSALTAALDPGLDPTDLPSISPIQIRFSKPMDPASASDALLTYPYVPGKQTWTDGNTALTFSPERPFQGGKTYYAFLDRDLKSTEGKQFEKIQEWQLQVRRGPSVVNVAKSPNGHAERLPSYEIQFDRDMDRQSIQTGFSMTPSAVYRFDWKDDRTLRVSLVDPLETGVQYALVLAGTVKDQEGSELAGGAYRWQDWADPLEVRLSGPDDISHIIQINFNYPIAEMADPVIEPEVAGKWRFSRDMAIFDAEDEFSSAQTYSVRLRKSLQDTHGNPFPDSDPIVFSGRPPIDQVHPTQGDSFTDQEIWIRFKRPMDHARIEAAFQLEPQVAGTFTWDDNVLTFKPKERLKTGSRYRVILKTSAADEAGRPILLKPYFWEFTVPEYYGLDSPYQASFGDYGQNAQVVDASGRRAIQFVLHGSAPARLFLKLYPLDLPAFIPRFKSDFGFRSYNGSGEIHIDGLPLYRSWEVTTRKDGIQELILPRDVEPGLYVLEMTNGSGPADRLFVALTHYTLAVKRSGDQIWAWLSDINGKSKADFEVRLYSKKGEEIREGLTDENGLWKTTVPAGFEPWLVVARSGSDVTLSGLDGSWGWNYYYWQNGSSGSVDPIQVYLYTDRPIYLPGQTVNYKAILRHDADMKYSLFDEKTPVNVRLLDGRKNVLQTQELETNAFGSVNGAFDLTPEGMLGDYQIELSVDSQTTTQSFQVEAYHKPEFEVKINSDAERFLAGDKVQVSVDARYFFDQPVASAAVEMKLYNLVTMNSWWWDGGSSDSVNYAWYEELKSRTEIRKTDADGRYSFSFMPDIHPSLSQWGSDPCLSSWRSSIRECAIGIEVTVDDGSGQSVTATKIIKVRDAAEILELDTEDYVHQAGQTFFVNGSVKDLYGAPIASRKLSLSLKKEPYSSSAEPEWTKDMETGADGRIRQAIVIQKSGAYLFTLEGKDERGNWMSCTTWVYIYGSDDTWANAYDSQVHIIAPPGELKPYQVARFMIQSSFSGPALLTFERGSVLHSMPVTLTAPVTEVHAQIIPEDAPNVYVTINAWQPQNTTLPESLGESDWWQYSNNLPDSRLRLDTVEIRVTPMAKSLQVKIQPERKDYGPGDQAKIGLEVTDETGKPVKAEVSLALVDEAIFSLSADKSRPIFNAFYGPRSHAVATYNSMSLSRELIAAGRGGGGGGGSSPFVTPRSDFRDTAAWFPAVVTGEDGKAEVQLTLPDNLTTWRLTARAVTIDTRVGQADTKIITQKEIIVRPLLPNSLVAGDRFELGAMIHNYGRDAQDLQVSLQGGLLQMDQAEQRVTLQPDEIRLVTWEASADTPGLTSVTVSASPLEGNGRAGDAVQLPLQIQPLAIHDQQIQAGSLANSMALTFVIPENAQDASRVRVRLARSISGSLLDGMEYLIGYPYGCVEQTMSRALPNAVVGRALKRLGVKQEGIEAQLPGLIRASVEKLYGLQHSDGGWGWWFDDETNDYQTAWVVFGLAMTTTAGYEVDSGVIERGAKWIEDHLNDMDPRTQAFALYGLAAAGKGSADLALQRIDQAAELDAFSQAALALALHAYGKDPEARAILAGLTTIVLEENGEASWPNAAEDGEYHHKTMASTTRSTALALEALVQIDPRSKLIPEVVRYLTRQRQGDFGWGTTNETAFTLIALTDYLLSVQENAANANYAIELNGEKIQAGMLSADQPDILVDLSLGLLERGLNLLHLSQDGDQPLYYTIETQIDLGQAQIEPSGVIAVSREYRDVKTGREVDRISMGSLVEVTLRVEVKQTGWFMLVEDQLPGGLEALNDALNTSAHLALGGDWGDVYSYYWKDYGYNQKEIRGGKVSFFIHTLEKGSHSFTYRARATRPGVFVALPAVASAMYDPAFWGRSGSAGLEVVK